MTGKLIVVFESTTPQGASVARALARCGEFSVRGLTNDLQSSTSQALKDSGVEMAHCDVNSRESIKQGLEGAYGCYVNTLTNFYNESCLDTEITQGCQIADQLEKSSVQRVILSSQLDSQTICSIMARHLIAKAEIEKYMKELQIPLTTVILPVFYEDLLGVFKPERTGNTNFSLEIPMGTTSLDMISVEDVGDIVVSAFKSPALLNKTLSVCGDKLRVAEMAQTLTRHLQSLVFKDQQLSTYAYSQKYKDLPGAQDLANMFTFLCRVDQRYNKEASKQMNPRIRTFDQWVQDNKDVIAKELLG